jgi:hypothetical protein
MRRRASAGLLAAMLAIVAGCGSSPSADAGNGSSQQASLAAFTKCLKQHGVSGFGVPGQGQGFGGGAPPSNGGGGTPPSQLQGQPPSGGFPGGGKMRKAFQACKSLAPTGTGGAP